MANDDLVRFFHTLQKKNTTLNQIKRFTGKSEASIYNSIVRWRQRGRIRTKREGNNRRVYELTESGKRFVEYSASKARKNRSKETKNHHKKNQKRY